MPSICPNVVVWGVDSTRYGGVAGEGICAMIGVRARVQPKPFDDAKKMTEEIVQAL